MKARSADARMRINANKYGVRAGDIIALFSVQSGLCGICMEPVAFGGWHGANIDHDHETHVVRGLLCPTCNKLLGKIEHLGIERVITYLASSYAITPRPRIKAKRRVQTEEERKAARKIANRKYQDRLKAKGLKPAT